MKTCTKCKRELSDTSFAKHVRRGETLGSHCKECKAEWRKSPERREVEKKRSAERRANMTAEDKLKRKCWRTMYYRTSTGQIVRPDKCQICGTSCEPQAHHDDYTKPLEITWCCQTCHSTLDQQRRTA